MTRPLFVSVLLLALATPSSAIDIGDAASLPWEGDHEYGLSLDYDLEKLPADTLALLGDNVSDDVSLLVRYETLRRAAAYLSVRGSAPEVAAPLCAKLQAALDGRAAGDSPTTLARLDAACFRSLTGTEVDAADLAGLALPRAELAYVLWQLTGDDEHLSAAIDGAKDGTRLSRNLLGVFDHEYPDLAALRKGLDPPDEGVPPDPGFPQPPPVPGADPSVRHGVTLLAPWRLVVKATDDGTAVTFAEATPWRVRVTVGHRMVIGTRITSRVHVDGAPVAAFDSWGLHGGEPIHAASSTSFLQDVPAGAVVKEHVEIFETDIPPQHHWGPTGGKFRVLWEHTYEAIVP